MEPLLLTESEKKSRKLVLLVRVSEEGQTQGGVATPTASGTAGDGSNGTGVRPDRVPVTRVAASEKMLRCRTSTTGA